MGKGSAARLAAKTASKQPPVSELQQLKQKNLKLQNDLKTAKAQIRTLKKDLAEEKHLRTIEQIRAEQQNLQLEADKLQLENRIEENSKIEKDSYTNQVRNLNEESKRVRRKWTNEVNVLTGNYKELVDGLKNLGDLASDIVTGVSGDQDPVTIVEFTKKIEEATVSLETIRTACSAILQNAVSTTLPTCKSCLVTFDEEVEEEEQMEVAPAPSPSPTGPHEAPTCQICLIAFSDEPGRVPRILRCGHTLCESCAQMIQRFSKLECPFDRTQTQLLMRNAAYLPKNFSILEVVNGGAGGDN